MHSTFSHVKLRNKNFGHVQYLMSTYNYRLFSSLLKLSPIFNFLPKNQKKISLIVEHTMVWRREKRWETICSRKETSSAQLHRNQPVLYHLSVFQKSLQDTTKYRGISSFIRQILAFTVYPGVLPFLIRKRGTPCPRNCLLSGSTNKSWYHLNQQQSSRVFMYLILLQK